MVGTSQTAKYGQQKLERRKSLRPMEHGLVWQPVDHARTEVFVKMIHRTLVGISRCSRMTSGRGYSGSWSTNSGWTMWHGYGCCESWSGGPDSQFSCFSESWKEGRMSSCLDLDGLSTINDPPGIAWIAPK
jgi:hypothetical protein